ncbi:MAG: serine/threonine-protein kinase [Alphaproteobacteria bacterium]|nr:serine/threonine-protein kinase [Alphaproteobacteria bacterium]
MFTLPGFTTIRSLGRGGFGQTWLLRRDSDGMHFAVKVLHQYTQDAFDRFAREARMLQRNQSNPYVVNIEGSFFQQGYTPYLLLEYCEGGSLDAWVTHRREWKAVTFALAHASAGLDYLHGLSDGFHRDIKPANLLLKYLTPDKSQWVVKVCDFGMARTPETVGPGMTWSPAGTPGYTAPELVTGMYHRPADIYSLGVTGIELLTGRKEPAALLGALGPTALHQLLRQMVSPDWTQRPSMSEVSARLRQILNPPRPKVQARPAPRPQPPSSGGGGWGWLAAAAGLTALALGTMNSKDSNGRWRGKDGRYRSGPWG